MNNTSWAARTRIAIAFLAVAAFIVPGLLAAQETRRGMTADEYVQALVAERAAGWSIRYSVAPAFEPCPLEDPWSNRAFQLMRDVPEDWMTGSLARAVARARSRCEDPRFDAFFLDALRRTARNPGTSTVTVWTTALKNYPTEVIRQPQFEAILRETALSHESGWFLQLEAYAAYVRERPFDERMSILLGLIEEGHMGRPITHEMAMLRRQYPDRFARAVADLLLERPPWPSIEPVLWYGAMGQAASPSARQYMLNALLSATENPRADWPPGATAHMNDIIRRLR